MKTCLIISAGDMHQINKDISYDFIIACDAGYDNCLANKLIPDLIIGDFDSYKKDIKATAGDIPVMTYPSRKDDSDTMLAVKYAIANGYEKIIIACALGGRLDHTIANIQALSFIASNGIENELFSDKEHLCVLNPGRHSFKREEGFSLSLFALSDEVCDIQITGSKYDVTDVTLYRNDPMGLSNEWIDEEIAISFSSGQLLAIASLLDN